MKKSVSVFICLVLLLSVLTGCGNSTANDVQPGNTESNRPGVNDSVGNDNNNGQNNGTTASPNVTDNSVTDDIRNGVDDAGNAVERGMDRAGKAINDATDDLTGNRK